jgi:hypothetical protein
MVASIDVLLGTGPLRMASSFLKITSGLLCGSASALISFFHYSAWLVCSAASDYVGNSTEYNDATACDIRVVDFSCWRGVWIRPSCHHFLASSQ